MGGGLHVRLLTDFAAQPLEGAGEHERVHGKYSQPPAGAEHVERSHQEAGVMVAPGGGIFCLKPADDFWIEISRGKIGRISGDHIE